MIFKQFHQESLGHASYLIGSEQTGEALVLDVRRDVNDYFTHAREQGLRIAYAADTHQHNDYLSGICELPERGDVKLLASARAEVGYKSRGVGDGDRLEMGEIVFEVMHTPGHTPEHISLLVTDRSRGDEPSMLLSGGALLVGDVARPDLLGGSENTKDLANKMCSTLQKKILTLPDHVEVYPTHVAGSLCGGNIGSRLSTTIGYERKMNKLLASLSEADEFVKDCLDLENLPAVPPYWKRMRKQNEAGPPLLGVLREPAALKADEFEKKIKEGAIVLDCRSPEAFSGSHIPNALNVGMGSSFPTWAGTVLPANTPYLLVLENAEELWQVCWELLRIGYELPEGWLGGGMMSWRTVAKPLESLPNWTVWDLRKQIEKNEDLLVLDVRQPKEWVNGYIEKAEHITGAELPEKFSELSKEKQIAVICGSGYRSSVVGSFLKSKDYKNVASVIGGMSAWKNENFPIV